MEEFTVALNIMSMDTSYPLERFPSVKFAQSNQKQKCFGKVCHHGVELHPAVFFKVVHASGGFAVVRCSLLLHVC